MRTDSLASFDAFDDPLVVVTGRGAVLDWNDSTLSVTEYGEETLSSMRLSELFDESGVERLTRAIGDVLGSGTATVEARFVTAEGDRLPYELKITRLADHPADAIPIAIQCRDISVLRELEREQQAVFNRMSDGFFAVDSGWRITYVNDRGAEILSAAMGRDIDADGMKGLRFWEEIPEALGTTFEEKYREAMRTQTEITFTEYYDPLDSWFEVRAYPSDSGLSVYFYDVTEGHRQRQTLARREEVLREIHDIIADQDRRFTEQVRGLLEIGRTELATDYGTLSEIRGEEYVFETVSADDDLIEEGDIVPLSATNCEIAAERTETLVLGDVARDAPAETDRAGYADLGIECYIGAPVYAESEDVYGTFCFYDTEPREGQFTEWEVTLVDLMSRWVSYELQRERVTERLQRQNEKLDQFASVVSHELRNPLEVLSGSLELAAESGDGDHFDRCRRALRRMEDLIEDLLALARAGTDMDEPEPVGLDSVVREAWSTVSTSDATLRLDTDRTVRADRQRLQQLLENLVRNSLEHTSHDVVVTVGSLPGGFYFEDDGPGIPDDDRERVFESGYTTKPDGTGFGLAIVAEVAQAHGWTVQVTDGTDGGARFEFTDVTGA